MVNLLLHKLFIMNLRGMNQPHKQQEVKDFLVANKIEIASLLETKIKEDKAKKVLNKVFSRYKSITNYNSHYNGRIWLL